MRPALTPAVDCVCAGDARQMGLAQGHSLRARIHGLIGSLEELVPFRIEQPWWLPFPLYRRLAAGKAARALVPALRRDAPAMLERLEGIAVGAGVAARNLCLINAMEPLLASVEERAVRPPVGGCSALGVRGSRARNGETVVARNFDYLPLVQPFFVFRESRPAGGFRSLDFAVAAQPGAIDGVNEKGLCITLNYAFMIDPARPAPLVTMAISEALAACATVGAAAALIASRPRWGAGILMLADAAGDLACLELSNTRSAVRRPEAGADWLAFTNVCHAPAMREVQVAPDAVFAGRVPGTLKDEPVLAWHADRAGRLEELVRARGRLGPEELAAIMADHGPSGVPDGRSPCVHTEYWRTTASLQWMPSRRRVRAAFSTACQAEYVELGLEQSG